MYILPMSILECVPSAKEELCPQGGADTAVSCRGLSAAETERSDRDLTGLLVTSELPSVFTVIFVVTMNVSIYLWLQYMCIGKPNSSIEVQMSHVSVRFTLDLHTGFAAQVVLWHAVDKKLGQATLHVLSTYFQIFAFRLLLHVGDWCLEQIVNEKMGFCNGLQIRRFQRYLNGHLKCIPFSPGCQVLLQCNFKQLETLQI